jgi:hypothetical protein
MEHFTMDESTTELQGLFMACKDADFALSNARMARDAVYQEFASRLCRAICLIPKTDGRTHFINYGGSLVAITFSKDGIPDVQIHAMEFMSIPWQEEG